MAGSTQAKIRKYREEFRATSPSPPSHTGRAPLIPTATAESTSPNREVASRFHTKIRELTTAKEQEKALKETVIRVKSHSIDEAAKCLEPTDMKGLQRLMNAKRELQDIQKLHISVN